MSREEQAVAYIVEAERTLMSARSIAGSASAADLLWAQAVKNGYDAIEQAVSAAVAARGDRIPRRHPATINAFLTEYDPPAKLEDRLLEWLHRRSDALSVDICGEDVTVRHERFDQTDAEEILADAEAVIEYVTAKLA